MDPIIIHAGDLRPDLYFQIMDQDGFINLNSATSIVTLKTRAHGTTTVLQTIICSKVYNGTTGWVKVEWPAASWDVDAGRYEGEISVDFNGEVQTVNRNFMKDTPAEWSKTFQIRVVEDF